MLGKDLIPEGDKNLIPFFDQLRRVHAHSINKETSNDRHEQSSRIAAEPVAGIN